MFDLEIDKIIRWINGGGYASVVLQLPEGLKVRSGEIVSAILDNTSAEPIVLGYPCYGACDLFTDFRRYGDALVHFGHSPIPALNFEGDILYIEAHTSIDIAPAVEKAASEFSGKVGLLATVQYVEMLPEVKRILGAHGVEAVIGKGDARICYPGQVLGCNCTSATAVQDSVDSFLYIGEGDFHPLAVAFGAEKPMRILNPVTGELRSVDDIRDRILRKRFAAIESARSADSFAVIVCGKVGQDRYSVARDIVFKLRGAGRKAYIVVMDEVTPDALLAFRVDAFVCTACPRVAMDDSVRYPKPMLTVTEVDPILGLRRWEDYRFDQF